MTVRVFGLGYDDNGSALLWPWALIVCDDIADLPAVGLQADMQAYVFKDENYYIVNAGGDWELDPDPDLYYATAPDFDALERRVMDIEEQSAACAAYDERSARNRAPRGNRVALCASTDNNNRGNRP